MRNPKALFAPTRAFGGRHIGLSIPTLAVIVPRLGVCISTWAENGVRLEGPRTLLPTHCLHLSSALLLGLPRVSLTG